MLMRCLLLIVFIFSTFQAVAEEALLAKPVIEKQESVKVNEPVDSVTPSDVEVGRHVMSNVDAGSMILSLLAVLVAIVVAAWVLKKFQVGGTTVNGLKIVTSLNLGSKERLVVVQVGEKQLLLGVTGQQINLLETLAEPIKSKVGMPIGLSQTLERFKRNSVETVNSDKYS